MSVVEIVVRYFVNVKLAEKAVDIFNPWIYQEIVMSWIEDRDMEYEDLFLTPIKRVDIEHVRAHIKKTVSYRDVKNYIFYLPKVRDLFNEPFLQSIKFSDGLFALAITKTVNDPVKIEIGSDPIQIGRVLNP